VVSCIFSDWEFARLLFQIISPEESLQQAIADFAQHCGGLRLGIREVAQVSARKGVSRKLGMARHACGLEQSVYRRQSADVGSNMASIGRSSEGLGMSRAEVVCVKFSKKGVR
jgi:hypothetical protein